MRDDENRVTCTACMAYREGRCTRAAAAGLHPDKYRPGTADVGRTLATLPQHCSAFSPARKAKP